MDICDLRASSNTLYRRCLEMARAKGFNAFISISIIVNTIILALDSYPVNIKLQMFIEWANIMFTVIFLFECGVRMLGYGAKIYFKDVANLFDFIVILFSLADLVSLYLSQTAGSSGMNAIQTLRVFRLLRVFKLAKIWSEFAYILVTVGNTLKKISSFLVLLVICIFSFSILGMELFAATLSFDEDNKPIIDDYDNGLENMRGNIPDSTFNTFVDAVIAVFIILANDGWSNIYLDHARVFRAKGQSSSVPTIFFLTLIVVGQHILFQLFLAILLQEFDERSLIAEAQNRVDKEKGEDKDKLTVKRFFKRILSVCISKCSCKKSSSDNDNENTIDENIEKEEKADESSSQSYFAWNSHSNSNASIAGQDLPNESNDINRSGGGDFGSISQL